MGGGTVCPNAAELYVLGWATPKALIDKNSQRAGEWVDFRVSKQAACCCHASQQHMHCLPSPAGLHE